MKTQNAFRLRCFLLSIFIVFMLLPASWGADEMKRGSVVVTEVQGGVLFANPANPEPRPLKKGDVIKQGATILTGGNASASLAFSNGSVVKVDQNSKFVIEKFMQSPWEMDQTKFEGLVAEPTTSETTAYLDFGEIIADVKKLNKGSSLEVSTPLGTAGVRGTAFSLKSERGPNGKPVQSQLTVGRGQVDFGVSGQPPVAVFGGTSSSIAPGGPQGDAPTSPQSNASGVDSQITQAADALRGSVGASAERLNYVPSTSVTVEQQQIIEQAAQQGEDALVETVTRLVTESPDQAVGIAEAATEQTPPAAPRIAAAAAIVSPNSASLIAAEVSSVIPPSAPEVAAAVARAVSLNAAGIAVAVANVVPTQTAQIAAAVSSSVPQSTLSVARAVAAAQPQQAERIADAVSQTAGGLDSDRIRNAVDQGAQEGVGNAPGGGSTGPQPGTPEKQPPLIPVQTPTPKPTPKPKPTPTPTPLPSSL